MNRSAALVALVTLDVVTVRSTMPAPGGATAVVELGELTAKLTALWAPKLTAPTPVKFVPAIATEIPPDSGPTAGLTLTTLGAERSCRVDRGPVDEVVVRLDLAHLILPCRCLRWERRRQWW